MERTRSIAPWFRAACAAVGLAAIYGGATALAHHFRMAVIVLSLEERSLLLGAFMLLASLVSILLLVFGFCLVRYCDAIASRYADGGHGVAYGEIAAYRLVFSLAGFLIVAWSLPLMANAILVYFYEASFQPRPAGATRGPITLTAIYSAQCAIGALVIVFAPRIVKWRNPINAPAAD